MCLFYNFCFVSFPTIKMAPSLFSTLSSALLLTSTVSAVQTYQVVDSYDSTNFLDKFGFFVVCAAFLR